MELLVRGQGKPRKRPSEGPKRAEMGEMGEMGAVRKAHVSRSEVGRGAAFRVCDAGCVGFCSVLSWKHLGCHVDPIGSLRRVAGKKKEKKHWRSHEIRNISCWAASILLFFFFNFRRDPPPISNL